MEKTCEELSKIAKKGINKYSRLSTKCMNKYDEKFRKETGKNPNNVMLKDEFFEFVTKNKVRCKR